MDSAAISGSDLAFLVHVRHGSYFHLLRYPFPCPDH